MKLAILGADRQTLAIARTITADQHDQWVGSAEIDSGPYAAEFRALRPARFLDNWEALLDSNLVDAVVVGYDHDEDRRAEQLRKFVQVGIPALASHPLFISALVYFELDTVRHEAGAILLPNLTDRLHPAIVELTGLLKAEGPDSIGRPEQVSLERHMAERSPAAIKAQFARDADLIACLAGELTHLGAMAGGSKSAFESLSVQMSGPSGVLARWSVAPAAEADSARLVLVAPRGRVSLSMPADGGVWTLQFEIGQDRAERQFPAWDPSRVALEQIRAALSARPVELDWLAAARSVELAETIDRSLARGRTIELHHEQYNEVGAFKSLMAASGCGLLLAVLFVMLAIGVIDDMFRAAKLPVRLLDRWPKLLLAALAIFLLLQLLLLAVRRDGKGKK